MNANPDPSSVSVMIIENSASVRGMMHRYFEPLTDIQIVNYTNTVAAALKMLPTDDIGLIILDLDLPENDAGQSAIPSLLEVAPKVRIIGMSAKVGADGDNVSSIALKQGASDIIGKPERHAAREEVAAFHQELEHKIRALAGLEATSISRAYPATAEDATARQNTADDSVDYAAMPVKYPALPPKALAIGSSTGGPEALTKVFTGLQGKLKNIPVFITQHLPPKFTSNLARHITQAYGSPCHEAEDGMPVRGGEAYLAPGDYHMAVEKSDDGLVIRLNQNAPENFCRPAVDPMLRSLTAHYGSSLLVAILTGMGHDGLAGAEVVVGARGTIIAQDRDSCVVWGMPRAVTEAELCSAVLPLDAIPGYVIRACGERMP